MLYGQDAAGEGISKPLAGRILAPVAKSASSLGSESRATEQAGRTKREEILGRICVSSEGFSGFWLKQALRLGIAYGK